MARDILSEFGRDKPSGRVSEGSSGLATGGGKPTTRDVDNYKPPQGPTGIMGNERPGLGGTVHPCGSQGPTDGDHDTGHPGIGSTDHGNKGSQR